MLGLTTDQILNNVFVSGSNALRVTGAGGGGFISGSGTSPRLARWSGSAALTDYAGSACSAGQVATSIGVDGVVACVTAGSTNITNVSGGVFVIPNKGTTGTTINKLAKFDTTASPATAVIATTADTTNVLGLVVSGAGTTGSATILSQGIGPCQFDNTATVDHYVVVSVTDNGMCHDTGSATTFPTGVMVLGKVYESGTTAAARRVAFNTPDVASASSGPNGKGSTVQVDGSNAKATANLNSATPAATGNGVNCDFQESSSGNTSSVSCQIDPATFVNLKYSGTLLVAGANVAAVSSSGNVASTTRIEDCTSGASAITRTLPAATGSGRIIDVGKIDSGAGTCIIGRTGSDAINSGTTRTLSARWNGDTCRDVASAQWWCRGDGT